MPATDGRYQCRSCTDNPICELLTGNGEKRNRRSSRRCGRGRPAAQHDTAVEARSHEEINKAIKQWTPYVQLRTRDFFKSREMLEEALRQVLLGIDRFDDPILGPEERCVFWYGNVTSHDREAVFQMVKPGETQETFLYVNRVLAFVFAAEESFEILARLPKDAFPMRCNDQMCITLAHISVQEPSSPSSRP
eukprot:TRINITY_DN19096_c0_g1_i2.p1 TRINITY_DN19096_c0_g1~~TRINITY_DN19096_c0_g1_i2.p1  ORF type:complete len:209 (-),score=38.23 TRINITY_DN19096_c0_g1_i2:43-618(-)